MEGDKSQSNDSKPTLKYASYSELKSKEQLAMYKDGENVLNLSEKIKIFIPPKYAGLLPGQETFDQMKNIENKLPGLRSVIGLPDLHMGKCFSIGSVVTTKDVIVPLGVGGDINCGVRMLKCNVNYKDVDLQEILREIYRTLPVGMGSDLNNVVVDNILKEINEKSNVNMTKMNFLNGVLDEGLDFLLKHEVISDYRDCVENGGKLPGDSKLVSQKAKGRGVNQLGSLGSGNHFLEFQRIDQVFMSPGPEKLNFSEDELVLMIHTGSRGLGFLVCEDAIEMAEEDKFEENKLSPLRKVKGENFEFFRKKETQEKYLLQMGSASNFAFVNRALINLTIDRVLEKHGIQAEIVYDVGHNSLFKDKLGDETLMVHRKGASRALAPGHPELSDYYRKYGQPVPIGGSMGTASYLLLAKDTKKTNYTCPHGAGRVITRKEAQRQFTQRDVKFSMPNILLLCKSDNGAIEEHPAVYKNIDDVANAAVELDLVSKIVRCVPLGVIKG